MMHKLLMASAMTLLFALPAAGTRLHVDAGTSVDLGSGQMKVLLEGLRETYDLVVIDSPPVSPVSDAKVLGRLADTTVFVVHWDSTPRELAARAVRELRQAGIRIAGVSLAQVNLKKQARVYYGGYGMRYYRKYANYYSN